MSAKPQWRKRGNRWRLLWTGWVIVRRDSTRRGERVDRFYARNEGMKESFNATTWTWVALRSPSGRRISHLSLEAAKRAVEREEGWHD